MTGGTLGKCYYVKHPYDQEGAFHRGKVIRVGGVDVCEERDGGSTKLGILGEGATFEIKETRIEFRNSEICLKDVFCFELQKWEQFDTSHFASLPIITKSTYGQRLQYVKMDGSGPQEGWISFYVAGRKAVARTGGVEWLFRETEVSAMGQRFGNPDPTQLDEDSMYLEFKKDEDENRNKVAW